MNYSSIKKLAVTSAVALALFSMPDQANAQVTISADFITAPALVIAAGNDIDFGTFVVDLDGVDTPTITIPPVVAGAPTAVLAGATASSTLIEAVASLNSGSVTVQTPTGIDNQQVDMVGTITDNFDDAGIALQNLTFATVTETGSNAVPGAFDGTGDVTVVTGGTPETVAIGGQLLLGTATPAAGTTFGGNTDVVITLNFAF